MSYGCHGLIGAGVSVLMFAMSWFSRAAEPIDGGVAILLRAQSIGQCLRAGGGIDSAASLKQFAESNGWTVGDDGTGTRLSIVSQTVSGKPDFKTDFFQKREMAFKRAYDAGVEALSEGGDTSERLQKIGCHGVTVIAQSEGVTEDSSSYMVSLLVCKSKGLDRIWSALLEGKRPEGILGGVSQKRWLELNASTICCPYMVILDSGEFIIAAGAAREIIDVNPKSVQYRKSKGSSELFAKQLTLRPILGKTFYNVKCRFNGLYGKIVSDRILEARYYQSVYAYGAESFPRMCEDVAAAVAAEQKKREEGIASAAKKATEDKQEQQITLMDGTDEKEPIPGKEVPLNDKPEVKNLPEDKPPLEKPVEIHPPVKEEEVAEAKPIVKPVEDRQEVLEKRPIVENQPGNEADSVLRDMCRRQGWCIGWDVENSRIIHIGSAEFKFMENDSDFFKKRNFAIRRAITEGLLKIACQLSFHVRDVGNGKSAIDISGASVLWMNEHIDKSTGMVCVSVVVTWSKVLEDLGKSISSGRRLPVPAGKVSVQDWLESKNPVGLSGPRVYFDSRGNGWFTAATLLRWNDGMMPNERAKHVDHAQEFLKEMLALGGGCVITVDAAGYGELCQEARNLPKEADLNRLARGFDAELKVPSEWVRGEREMIDVRISYPLTGENVRALVYGINGSFVKNAIK